MAALFRLPHDVSLPVLPPRERSRAMSRMAAAAGEGRLEFQRCRDCGRYQYPPRDACGNCLSVRLEWTECDGRGALIAQTTLHHSNEPYFRGRLPFAVGTLRLDIGVNVVVLVDPACAQPPSRVILGAHIDAAGLLALIARPEDEGGHAGKAGFIAGIGIPLRGSKAFVTNAAPAAGAAIARALVAAGCGTVWTGFPELPGSDAARKADGTHAVQLDIRDPRSVNDLAGLIGGDVDILVNTAEFQPLDDPEKIARGWLPGLVEAFAPPMAARAARDGFGKMAWVNLLSVDAFADGLDRPTHDAGKADALGVAQSLRNDFRDMGIRVINAFPGPLDEERTRRLAGPKLAPRVLAVDIVSALARGVEDIYPGEIAQDMHARWRRSANSLEISED